MNIFYEEGGQFKVATVVQKNPGTYQVDTQHGKRSKVRANNVFLEFDADLSTFFAAAQEEADEIDTPLLWEVCGQEEFDAQSIATEYFGSVPTKTQYAAVLIALYAAPMYFYKKGKGIFKAAPADVLQQALAAIERKKQQEIQIAQWSALLQEGKMPEEIDQNLKNILHAPDKQSLAYKAFTQAASALKMSVYELGKHIGGITSVSQFLQDRFEAKHFPKGIDFPELSPPQFPDLPLADGVRAFSLDDASTTEIDDALSVQRLENGCLRVGVHIAAPSLAVCANDEVERIIFERLSTVYFPNGKITMLPENYLAAFSMDEGVTRPAFSIYFEVDEAGQIQKTESCIERVTVEKNLWIQEIEPYFNSETGIGDADAPQFPFHSELIDLYHLARQRQTLRDRLEQGLPKRYDYGIEFDEEGNVKISRRERGSPIDTVVSEMMILANSSWAAMLAENDVAGIFRVQTTGRVRMSTRSEPHVGMNLQHYGWFTSPLRRAVDYINQKQLHSLLVEQIAPRFERNDSELFATLGSFDSAYDAYREFQDTMEAYWSMVYLEQEQIKEVHAILLKEDLVRIEGMPLLGRASGIPFEIEPKSRILLALSEVDSEKQFVAFRYLNRAPLA